jgi:hypothetical protein
LWIENTDGVCRHSYFCEFWLAIPSAVPTLIDVGGIAFQRFLPLILRRCHPDRRRATCKNADLELMLALVDRKYRWSVAAQLFLRYLVLLYYKK